MSIKSNTTLNDEYFKRIYNDIKYKLILTKSEKNEINRFINKKEHNWKNDFHQIAFLYSKLKSIKEKIKDDLKSEIKIGLSKKEKDLLKKEKDLLKKELTSRFGPENEKYLVDLKKLLDEYRTQLHADKMENSPTSPTSPTSIASRLSPTSPTSSPPIASRRSPKTNPQTPIASRLSPKTSRLSPKTSRRSPKTNPQTPIASRPSPKLPKKGYKRLLQWLKQLPFIRKPKHGGTHIKRKKIVKKPKKTVVAPNKSVKTHKDSKKKTNKPKNTVVSYNKALKTPKEPKKSKNKILKYKLCIKKCHQKRK